MPAARNEAREAAVKALNKIARDVDIPGVTWDGCRIKILEARLPHVRRGDQRSAEALGDSYLIL